MNVKSTFQTLREQIQERLGGKARMTALSAFIRPDLRNTPKSLRPVLEPLVMIAAVTALTSLALLALACFGGVVAASFFIYLIIKFVFGIELDVWTPQPN